MSKTENLINDNMFFIEKVTNVKLKEDKMCLDKCGCSCYSEYSCGGEDCGQHSKGP